MTRFCTFLTAIFLMAGAALWADEAGPRLTVSGSGAVEIVPDLATITLGVTEQSDTAANALAATSAVTGELFTLLSEIGIEREDMQTSNLHMAPVWESDRTGTTRQRIVGYRVSNNVLVRIRSFGDLGVILDDIVASGVNEFHGLQFGVAEPEPHQDAARTGAVLDARRKAELLAQAAGVKLGRLLEINDTGARAPAPIAVAQFAARAGAVPIAAGELTISAQVTLVYEILEQ